MRRFEELTSQPELALAVKRLGILCDNTDLVRRLKAGNDEVILLFLSALENLENLKEVCFEPNKDFAYDPDSGANRFVDFSGTFSFVLWALVLHGVRPQRIMGMSDNRNKANFSITKCNVIPPPAGSGCLSELRQFGICLGRSNFDYNLQADTHLTKRLLLFLNQMRSLTHLSLSIMDVNESLALFKSGLPSVYLPCLTSIDLDRLCCRVNDITSFLRQHAKSLRKCQIFEVDAVKVDLYKEYRDLLETCRDVLELDSLVLGRFADTDRVLFDFPQIDGTSFDEEPIETDTLKSMDASTRLRECSRYRRVCL